VRADDIYALIAQEQLYVDLSAVPLAQPWRVMLYLDQQAQEADVLARGATTTPGLWDFPASAQLMPNTSLLWDGRLWTLINLGEETTTVLPETGQPIQLPTEFFLRLLSDGTISLPKAETELSVNQEVQCLMKAASKADLAKANYRFHLVQAYLQRQAMISPDQGEHEALGTTPREAYLQGMSQAGEREHRRIPYNEEFLMATRPSTLKGEATVQPGKGIKVNYLYYWSDAFRNPEVERTPVPVRYDPFDVGVAYAYVQGRWVKCLSQYYSIFEGHSEKELLLASQEIRQQGKRTRTADPAGTQFQQKSGSAFCTSPSVSAPRLAEFIANVQEHETLLLQRLRDLEGKQVQNALMNSEVTTVTEVVPTETELLRASQATPSRAKETELEVPPVDLSRLPVFGEYR
jgi:hypothetical protein